MILGINAIGARHSGGATILKSLIEGLNTLPLPEHVVVFLSPKHVRAFDVPLSDRMTYVDCPWSTIHPLLRYYWMQTWFAKKVDFFQCDALINLNNIAGALSLPQLLFIQQSLYFSHEALSAYQQPGVPNRMRQRMFFESRINRYFIQQSCRAVSKIVVQTHTMRQQVGDAFHLSPERIAVLPPARPSFPDVRHASPALCAMRQGGGYNVLYVGNNQPYKNLRLLLATAHIARERGKDWRFFLTCNQYWQPLPANVMLVGHLDREALAEAYRLSHVVVMPSFVETVGLPMIEAMMFEKPVVAVNRPYAHEICGNAALYVDPYSAEDCFHALEQIVSTATQTTLHEYRRAALARFPSVAIWAHAWLDLFNDENER